VSAALDMADRISSHRSELKAYCHRMLGSPFEADDAVQETLLRAWRGASAFEGRAALRTWLYRIATNVCVDAAHSRSRRPTPIDAWGEADTACDEADPADLAMARENVRLALVVAVRALPPRQRAVLLLREVLCWRAAEVAELLETSVAAVNSALHRAHARLAAADLDPAHATLATADLDPAPAIGAERGSELVARYLAAFDADDVDALTELSVLDVAA
jgi:RNA polymerase sigma-70 factor (ECF subfamily)